MDIQAQFDRFAGRDWQTREDGTVRISLALGAPYSPAETAIAEAVREGRREVPPPARACERR